MDGKPGAEADADADAEAVDGNDQAATAASRKKKPADDTPLEVGGPKGAEPTRFGDWERNGRCVDF